MSKRIFGSCQSLLRPFKLLGEMFVETWWVWAAIITFSALVTFVTLVIVKFWFGVI